MTPVVYSDFLLQFTEETDTDPLNPSIHLITATDVKI